MKIRIECNLSHLNVRRERAGDGPGEVAVDLKLTATVKHQALKPIFTDTANYAALVGALFDEAGELSCPEIQSVRLQREFVNGTATLKSPFGDPQELDDVKLNKVTLTPHSGGLLDITLRLQATPKENQLSVLGTLLAQTVELVYQGKQAELELPAQPDKGAEAPAMH